MADIDLSSYGDWTPLGDDTTAFTGTLDGNGHIIQNLSINRSGEYNGLFGYTSGSIIKNLGLTGVSVTLGDYDYTGSLIGYSESSDISDCYARGTINSQGSNVGGVAGYSDSDTIADSYADVNITISLEDCAHIGGLVGSNNGSGITGSYATGNISNDNTDGNRNGGLIGTHNSGTVSECYATGNVTGVDYTGGLIGLNGGTVENSYSTGDITADDRSGGLIGHNQGAVSYSYATGSVTGDEYIGGFTGYNRSSITDCYAAGTVSGDRYVGGFLGFNYNPSGEGSVNNGYAANTVSGTTDVGGFAGGETTSTDITNSFFNNANTDNSIATAISLTAMRNVDTFTETDTTGLDSPWDFTSDPNDDAGTEDIWSISGSINSGYPYLTGMVP
jgi:hypothetical protein